MDTMNTLMAILLKQNMRKKSRKGKKKKKLPTPSESSGSSNPNYISDFPKSKEILDSGENSSKRMSNLEH